MLYGAVPLFISDHMLEVGAPFRCLVPYHLLSIAISERAFSRDPARALRQVDRLSSAEVSRMQALVGYFRQDLLWRHPQSRVAENVLIDAARALGLPGMCCPFDLRDELLS